MNHKLVSYYCFLILEATWIGLIEVDSAFSFSYQHNIKGFSKTKYDGNIFLRPISHKNIFTRDIALFSSSTGEVKLTEANSSRTKKRKENARSVAVAALVASAKGSQKKQANSFTVQKLEANPAYKNLEEQRDRSYARNLVSTVERRMGQIDTVLSMCAKQYPPKSGKHAAAIQACLRIGAAQILFLDTPVFAAVKETVDVLRMQKNKIPEPMIKFVNAVLRRLGRDGMEMLEKHTTASQNIAPWLVEEWKKDWGEENTMKICEEMFVEPHTDLTVNFGPWNKSPESKLTVLENLRSEFGSESTILPNYSIRTGSNMKGAVTTWPHFDEGKWWVQDVSSTLPAIALYNGLAREGNDISQLNVVDMCSAPGGKTAQLISAGFGHVTAVEANARRCRRLEENLKRLGFQDKCTIVVSEGQNWNGLESSANRMNNEIAAILVDVPCSATGTGSRRPDVLRRSNDLGNLLETQEAIANHCVDNLLTIGSIMIYATCSLLKRESEDQVQKLLSRGNPDENKAVMKTSPFVPGEIDGFDAAIDENGWLRVLPGVLDENLKSCDGFFVARLEKIG